MTTGDLLNILKCFTTSDNFLITLLCGVMVDLKSRRFLKLLKWYYLFLSKFLFLNFIYFYFKEMLRNVKYSKIFDLYFIPLKSLKIFTYLIIFFVNLFFTISCFYLKCIAIYVKWSKIFGPFC